jgi:hypothetical protein
MESASSPIPLLYGLENVVYVHSLLYGLDKVAYVHNLHLSLLGLSLEIKL